MYLFYIQTAKMQKPEKYDWKDSNMALFGSDTEKQVGDLKCCHDVMDGRHILMIDVLLK